MTCNPQNVRELEGSNVACETLDVRACLTVNGVEITGGGGGGALLTVGPVMFFGFNAAANLLYPLTGNHEINGNIFLPLASVAGNGARCGFKLYNGNFGPVWRIFPGPGDTIDVINAITSWNFPDNNAGRYVEWISDGVSSWYLRSVVAVP
jgi:hypothetical protein